MGSVIFRSVSQVEIYSQIVGLNESTQYQKENCQIRLSPHVPRMKKCEHAANLQML